MKELAVVERYVFGKLQTISSGYGWSIPQIAPFDLQDGADIITSLALPILYFRLVGTGDRNAVGPGPRVLTFADYEIGIFHDRNTFGAALPKSGGTVDILEVLGQLDDIFQNYTPPIVDPNLGGVVYSVERQFAVRIPERSGGKLYRRDGGVFRFHVEAS